MNPWFGKLAVLACLLGFIVIRAPHGQRSRAVRVKEDRKGVLEIVLLIGAMLGTTLLPLIWVATGFPARDYPPSCALRARTCGDGGGALAALPIAPIWDQLVGHPPDARGSSPRDIGNL